MSANVAIKPMAQAMNARAAAQLQEANASENGQAEKAQLSAWIEDLNKIISRLQKVSTP